MPTLLDENQILQGAYDETSRALNVQLQSSITVGAVSIEGYDNSAPYRNNYASVNVTTGAYVQLVNSTPFDTEVMEIFDSSGRTLALATGGSGSEIDQFYIFPGGNGRINKHVAAGTRISIKAISANATAGEIVLNIYGN